MLLQKPTYLYCNTVITCRCEGCGVKPIEGPRFHCQVCADFDFCQDCFIRGQAHNHVFERVDDQGYPAVYVGSPRSCRLALRKKKKVHVNDRNVCNVYMYMYKL